MLDIEFIDIRDPDHCDYPLFGVGSEQAIGQDLRAYLPEGPVVLSAGDRAAIPTGFKIRVPTALYGRIAPRSGLAFKNGIDVLAGVIDPDFRGEVKVILINHGTAPFTINNGDRIAQMIMEVAAQWKPLEVKELDNTERGEKGYGSSGIK